MQFGATVLRPMCGDRGICISPHLARDQVSCRHGARVYRAGRRVGVGAGN
jgi:hypothetical protein